MSPRATVSRDSSSEGRRRPTTPLRTSSCSGAPKPDRRSTPSTLPTPSQVRLPVCEEPEAQDHAARVPQPLVAAQESGAELALVTGLEHGDGCLRRARRFRSVTQPVDHGHQHAAVPGPRHEVLIARLASERAAWRRSTRRGAASSPPRHRPHFLTLTTVPLPTVDEISNSSMSRFTPGNPTPMRPDVEYPSCSA